MVFIPLFHLVISAILAALWSQATLFLCTTLKCVTDAEKSVSLILFPASHIQDH